LEALETEFAAYIGTRHAVGVANGTDAIELAVRALDLAPGDEVITVSHTAVATVAAIECAGAVPVLVDIDAEHFTIDPSLLEGALTDRTRAVVAVHIYGQAADLTALGAFCEKHNLYLIEDTAQAHGATYFGKRLGSIGHIGCFSFYPTKNLGALGDAGMVTTNSDVFSDRLQKLRQYGWRDRYISEFAGRNSRLDEIQAAVLRVKLPYLDADNLARQRIADIYDRHLHPAIVRPLRRADAGHVFHLYVVRVKDREKIMQGLQAAGIFAGIHYPMPVHKQAAYAGRIRCGSSMAVSERVAGEILSLPLYPELGEEKALAVVSAINGLI
jgi:dTDP-4-amino-4,6-dideoxygalactose transaminase